MTHGLAGVLVCGAAMMASCTDLNLPEPSRATMVSALMDGGESSARTTVGMAGDKRAAIKKRHNTGFIGIGWRQSCRFERIQARINRRAGSTKRPANAA